MRESFFTVPIFYIDMENSEKINHKLLNDILQWKKEDEKGTGRSNNLGWHSQEDMNLRDEFEDIKNIINEKLNSISLIEQYSSEADLVIEEMWANVSPKYAYNSYHFHPYSLWSGVYYVKAPENSGQLKVEDPRSVALMVRPRMKEGKPPQRLWREASYDPKPGRLIMFPSWLNHCVDPNNSNDIRISVSFNFMQKCFMV